jgi:hypothetical protein
MSIGSRRAVVYLSVLGVIMTASITGVYTHRPTIFRNVKTIGFDTDYAGGCEEGGLSWNTEDGTLEVGMPGGDVCLQIGQEILIRGKNETGSQIDNGDVVYVSGASGSRPTLALADASNHAQATLTLAVATEDIDNNGNGYCTSFGIVRDVNTVEWAAGTPLFLSTTAGDLTDVAPTAPDSLVAVAYVLFSNVESGVLGVRITPSPNIEELSNIHVASVADNDMIRWDNSDSRWENTVVTVDTPFCISMFDATPTRASATEWNGGLLGLSIGDTLGTGDDITVTKGIGKIFVVVNTSNDAIGDITITGDTVDRDTGAISVADTDTMTLDGDSTDSSTTDSNGNPVYVFTDSYISSKWFTGSVVLSTTEVDLTDVDVYHVSFEQCNDNPDLTINSFDINLYTTNVAAEFDGYLYTIHKDAGDKCHVDKEVDLHVGADGQTAIANKYWRLRYGVINEALDGTTDGFWCEMHYSNSPVYVEDVTAKVWLTKTSSLDFN